MSGDLAATRLFPTPQPLYEERNTKVAVSTAIGFALATAGVVLRFTSRLLQRKRIDFSDYLIIAAYVSLLSTQRRCLKLLTTGQQVFKLGLDISSIYLVRFGIGHHLQVVSFGDLRAYFQTLYVATWIYPLCIGFTKLSILSIYWNAFPSAYIRLSVKVVGAVIAAWAIACCLVGVFECTPVHKSWDAGAVGHCTDTRAYYRGLQVPNIITDFVILLLPLKAISELRLATNRNLELAGIFICGVVYVATLLLPPRYLPVDTDAVTGQLFSTSYFSSCFCVSRSLI